MAIDRETYEDIKGMIDMMFEHPLVIEVMKEYAQNMKFKEDSLPAFGLHKCMVYGATVAICNERDIDPQELTQRPKDF
jgi:hypothetical protein